MAIIVNMVKARDIHRDHLRDERAPLLAQLDVDYIRADEIGDDAEKARIAARKQTLRDATTNPDIDTAQTIEVLKRVTLP